MPDREQPKIGAVELIRAYEDGGEFAYLIEAVSLLRADIRAVPIGHPSRAAALSNLGNALRCVFGQARLQGKLASEAGVVMASATTPERSITMSANFSLDWRSAASTGTPRLPGIHKRA